MLPVATDAADAFRVVIVNGPRQAGKSTLLRDLHTVSGGTIATLDDRDSLRAARTDPAGFVEDQPHPLFVDEVQRGGDRLVLAIKAFVDRRPEPGTFVLAGSSRFLTVPGLTESLAGRARILDLWPFTQGELHGGADSLVGRLFEPPSTLRGLHPDVVGRSEIFERVAIGGFPAAASLSRAHRDDWCSDYVRTMIDRDLRQLRVPRRAIDLDRLVRLLAQRTAQELVVSSLGAAIDLGKDAMADYLALLETIYLIHRIPAWTPGGSGRVRRRPKIHFVDSGLAASVLNVSVDELVMPVSSMAGALLESFAVNEFVRQLSWDRQRARLYHYRDAAQREIDLILELPDGRITGIEVKAARSVDETDFRHLIYLRDLIGDRFVNGVVLHLGDRSLAFGDRMTSLPVSALWAA